MSQPSITTVVVTHGGRPELLERALDAICLQDVDCDHDVLVVFDQAEPDVALTGLRHGRQVRALAQTRSPGLAGGRNTGCLATDADLVAFCDDDDEWLPGRLAAQVALLADHPDAISVSCGVIVDYDGREVERPAPAPVVTLADLVRSRVFELHPSTLLSRRDGLIGVGLVDEEVPGGYGEDWDLLLRVARVAPIPMVSEPLVRIRWHAGSYFAQRWTTIAEACEWLLDRHPELRADRDGTALLSGKIAFAEAAQGNRRSSLRWIGRTLRASWREPRAYVAAAATLGVPAERILAGLHSRGRGI